MSTHLSITQVKLWLYYVKTKTQLYSPLSLNLVREICLYLSTLHILPCIHDRVFRLHSFETGQFISAEVSVSYTKGASFCPYTTEYVLCVGDSIPTVQVYNLNLKTYQVERVADMHTARQWVGVISYGLYVYVFGGNINPSIKAVEKFDTRYQEWFCVPPMLNERCCFTPTEHFGTIYLIEPCARSYPFEGFCPKTETYTSYPVSFKAYSYGVISFIDADSLVILQFSGKLHRWKIGGGTLETQSVKWTDQDFAVTVCPPIRVNNAVYWISYRSKRLIKYDILSTTASVVEGHARLARE